MNPIQCVLVTGTKLLRVSLTPHRSLDNTFLVGPNMIERFDSVDAVQALSLLPGQQSHRGQELVICPAIKGRANS